MKIVKKAKDYIIFKKRSGRFGIRRLGGAWINGRDKIKILFDEGLSKVSPPAKSKQVDQAEQPAQSKQPAEAVEEQAVSKKGEETEKKSDQSKAETKQPAKTKEVPAQE